MKDQRVPIIISLILLLFIAGWFWYRQSDCEQKKCPPGLKPYMGAYDAKCLCIKEAE